MIYIAEIFGPTIQGEGPNVGIKTLFVRVAGCSFKCDWCDSKFAWSIENAKKYTEDELTTYLITKCNETNTSHVILTGGNPCLYNFTDVIDMLHFYNISVDVETQGDLYPTWLNQVDLVVISPKAPSSKMPDVYDRLNNYLCAKPKIGYNKVCIKIPIFNDEDFKFAERYYELVKKFRSIRPIELYLSVGNINTNEGGDISNRVLTDYKLLIEKICNSKMDRVFVLPQVHTLVWGNKQGV